MKRDILKLAACGVMMTVAATSAATSAHAQRDQIRIVGSSTVFPFATAVAEEFGETTNFKTPIVESTGSGGGLKLFCSGVGQGHPDITNASRRIKASEVEMCGENGVGDIVEVKIGYDGIVLGQSRAADQFSLTLKQVWLALAAEVPGAGGKMTANPARTWSDVDPSLPATKIEVLGPPPTSGTRDAFVELAMEGGCKAFPEIKALKKSDGGAYKRICHSIREDGAYVEAGENDNLIVSKLQANPNTLGIFGFSFLDQNADVIQGASVEDQEPTFEAIADGDYPVSRSLYFYVKKAHVGVIPGIQEYLNEFASEKAWGEYGYLTDKGLIPMPDGERKQTELAVRSLKPLQLLAQKAE